MKKLLQINTTVGWNSTGRIATKIGEIAVGRGWRSVIAYGRRMPGQDRMTGYPDVVKIGSPIDNMHHGIITRLCDAHGMGSRRATRSFIKEMDKYEPDVVHLHNIHGYYLHIPTLFDALSTMNVPVVWTFHDFWPVTGHCAFYTPFQCDRWKKGCHDCPGLNSYPMSKVDRCRRNYKFKQAQWAKIEKLYPVAVSEWMRDELSESMLGDRPIEVIYNGIEHNDVARRSSTENPIVLGLASVWDERKGLSDIIALRERLPANYRIVVVGLSERAIRRLPDGVEGVGRVSDADALGRLYATASVLVNPSRAEALSTVNLEAQSNGTPVVAYRGGSMAETMSENSGITVDRGDIRGLEVAIRRIVEHPEGRFTAKQCRAFIREKFDRNSNYEKYIDLYDRVLQP